MTKRKMINKNQVLIVEKKNTRERVK